MYPTDPSQQPQAPQYDPQPQPVQPQAPAPQPQPIVSSPAVSAADYTAPSQSSNTSPLLGIIGLVVSVIALITYPILGSYAESYWLLLIVVVLGLAGAGLSAFALIRSGNKINTVILSGFVIGLIVFATSFSYIIQATISTARIKALQNSTTESLYDDSGSTGEGDAEASSEALEEYLRSVQE